MADRRRRLKHWGWGYEDQQRPQAEVEQAVAQRRHRTEHEAAGRAVEIEARAQSSKHPTDQGLLESADPERTGLEPGVLDQARRAADEHARPLRAGDRVPHDRHHHHVDVARRIGPHASEARLYRQTNREHRDDGQKLHRGLSTPLGANISPPTGSSKIITSSMVR